MRRFALLLSISALAPMLVATSAFAQEQKPDSDAALKEAKAISAKGLELARVGKFEEAIDHFKRADGTVANAANDCNIALAYVRLKNWPRAELFVNRCKRRWVREKTSPLPTWLADGHAEVTRELASGRFAPIKVSTNPSGGRIASPAFAEDESIASPATLWLPFGSVVVSASLDGFEPSERELVIDNRTAQSLVITLEKRIDPEPTKSGEPNKSGEDGAQTAAIDRNNVPNKSPNKSPTSVADLGVSQPDTPEATPRGRTTALVVTVVGASLIAAGGVSHALALGAKKDAEATPPGPAFDDFEQSFGRRRTAAFALYGVGGAALGVGLYLLFRPEADTQVGASVSGDGAAVTFGWAMP